MGVTPVNNGGDGGDVGTAVFVRPGTAIGCLLFGLLPNLGQWPAHDRGQERQRGEARGERREARGEVTRQRSEERKVQARSEANGKEARRLRQEAESKSNREAHWGGGVLWWGDGNEDARETRVKRSKRRKAKPENAKRRMEDALGQRSEFFFGATEMNSLPFNRTGRLRGG